MEEVNVANALGMYGDPIECDSTNDFQNAWMLQLSESEMRH